MNDLDVMNSYQDNTPASDNGMKKRGSEVNTRTKDKANEAITIYNITSCNGCTVSDMIENERSENDSNWVHCREERKMDMDMDVKPAMRKKDDL